jgi:ribosomal protein L18
MKKAYKVGNDAAGRWLQKNDNNKASGASKRKQKARRRYFANRAKSELLIVREARKHI